MLWDLLTVVLVILSIAVLAVAFPGKKAKAGRRRQMDRIARAWAERRADAERPRRAP